MDKAKHSPKAKQPFRFKQFSLTDEGCAMKIGTDGLLLGAFGAKTASEYPRIERVLDIGTGCGIVALMVAQKCNGLIHAIDKDPRACATATVNFQNSPWNERLFCHQSPIQQYTPPDGLLFDLILCNPPYFQGSLQSSDLARSVARHNHSLDFTELFFCSRQLLSQKGLLIIIYPFDLLAQVSSIASSNGLFEDSRMTISASYGSKAIRVISRYALNPQTVLESSHMAIETGERHQFSEAYQHLTRDYHPFLG